MRPWPVQPLLLACQAARGGCSFDGLPDDLVCKVFSMLPLLERHGSLALVCRRWSRLACAPELLAEVGLQLQGERWLPRTLAFLAWLARRAGAGARPHSLRLKLSNPGGASEAEAYQVLAALACACSAAAPTLRHLSFDPEAMPLRLGAAASWASALAGLERLRLDVVVGELSLAADLSGLAGLRELWLDGQPLHLLPSARLPRGLTALRLGGQEGGALPTQLAELSCLRRLTLRGVEYSGRAEGYALLTRLGSLRELVLLHCTHLPACLPALTQLTALLLTATPTDPEGDGAGGSGGAGGPGQALQAALEQLSQLAHLAVRDCPYASSLPSALAGLPALQRLCWDGAPTACWALPPGACMAALRHLALPARTAAASLALLAAATPRLESLALRMISALPDGSQAELLHLAGAHPTLRRLDLASLPRLHLGPRALAALLAAQLRKPALRVQLGGELFQELSAVE